MNQPQNTKIKSKRCEAIFENSRGKWPAVLLCWQLWWQICQSNHRTPFHRHTCHQWMASKYPCKHESHEQWKKLLKFALRMNKGKTLGTSFLSSHQMPGYKFSDLNSFKWKNAGEKFIGESGLVFEYVFIPFLILVIRIKMCVWVLLRLEIESLIPIEKDFISTNMFINLNEMTRLWIFDKTFFPKSWASILAVQLICECRLYSGVYGNLTSCWSVQSSYLFQEQRQANI